VSGEACADGGGGRAGPPKGMLVASGLGSNDSVRRAGGMVKKRRDVSSSKTGRESGKGTFQ